MTKVWVLTSEYNDYDQHGEYFEAVFYRPPTATQLAKLIPNQNNEFYNFLLGGGGRQDDEYVWYNLQKVDAIS